MKGANANIACPRAAPTSRAPVIHIVIDSPQPKAPIVKAARIEPRPGTPASTEPMTRFTDLQ